MTALHLQRAPITWVLATAIAAGGIATIPAVSARDEVAKSPVVSWDMVWLVVNRCVAEEAPGFAIGYMAPGLRDIPPRVRLLSAPEGGIAALVAVESPDTRAVQQCLDGFTYDWVPYVERARPGEWALAYRWANEFTRPCLAAHGMLTGELDRDRFQVQSGTAFAAFIDAFVSDSRPTAELLEIRRDCPFTPPFLASTVRDW